ncbi:TolC family protein [Formosa sp. Hel3_A1_48]|uniref:TolC family protein n=1 Tax=Formosa sp. Hel3_A1_48 TaxID=1336795 RepID=UPI00084E112A|nr:TolC family protein [Formosa sp. Hel3_A1_48]
MHKLIYLIMLSFTVFAQDYPVLAFSLEEAVEHALLYNNTAQNSTSDVRLAQLQKWQTTSTGLPQINANISYNNWIQQQISLIPAEFFGGNVGEFTEVAFGTKQSMNGTLTISQKIFDGSYLVGLQAAKVYLEISKNAQEKTYTELRIAVTNSYGNILLTEENIKILNANITVIEKNIEDLEKVYENGMTEKENIEQLQLTRSGLISAKNYNLTLKDLAYAMFNLTIGVDTNATVVLTDSMEDLIALSEIKNTTIAKNSVENTIDFQIARNDLKSKELLLKLEKSKALPTINAFVNGTYSGNSNNFDFLDQSQKWFGASVFGLNMSIPLFSSLGRSALTQKAKINLEKSERDLNNLRQQILVKIKSAKNDLTFAKQDLVNKKQGLDLAKRIEQKNQIKFFEGLASSFELSQAQAQLYTAQQQYIQAMLYVLNKHIALDVLLNPNQIN